MDDDASPEGPFEWSIWLIMNAVALVVVIAQLPILLFLMAVMAAFDLIEGTEETK